MTAWIYKDTELRGILEANDDPDNEEESVTNTVKQLIPHLKSKPYWKGFNAQRFRRAKTFYAFNRILDELFDFADANRIWIDF